MVQVHIQPVITVFITCCMLFSGVLFALQAEESPATESPNGVTCNRGTCSRGRCCRTRWESIVEEEVKDPAALKLEETLKKNSKCLRCHNRDRTKLLEDGKEMSLQVHKEDYLASAHGEVRCTSCHRAIGNRKHPSKSTNITHRKRAGIFG